MQVTIRLIEKYKLQLLEFEFVKLEILTLTIVQTSDCQLAAQDGVRPDLHARLIEARSKLVLVIEGDTMIN